MSELYTLTICSVRRLIRNRSLWVPLALAACLLGWMEVYQQLQSSISAAALAAACLLVSLVQILYDKQGGFEQGILSTGISHNVLKLQRVIFTATLYLAFYALKYVIFFIL